jgi:hypothetical protein
VSKLSIIKPEIGKPDATEDVKIVNALAVIEAWGNGEIDSTNLKGEGVESSAVKTGAITEAKLSVAVQLLLNAKTAGGETKKSIIATEQSRENAAYGLLATPDEVTVVLPENGLILIGYQASWKSSANEAGAAALFIGANQLKRATASSSPAVQEVKTPKGAIEFSPLATGAGGLASLGEGYTGDVTTGQIVGTQESYGLCAVFAAAATYKVSVQFKASSGKVTVKNRKLWALVIA